MKSITTKELAKGLNCSYPVAAGIMKIMVSSGQAKLLMKIFHKSGKGKPTRVYSVANKVKINIPTVNPSPTYKIVGNKIIQTKTYKKAV